MQRYYFRKTRANAGRACFVKTLNDSSSGLPADKAEQTAVTSRIELPANREDFA
jgi:hypothetical protein